MNERLNQAIQRYGSITVANQNGISQANLSNQESIEPISNQAPVTDVEYADLGDAQLVEVLKDKVATLELQLRTNHRFEGSLNFNHRHDHNHDVSERVDDIVHRFGRGAQWLAIGFGSILAIWLGMSLLKDLAVAWKPESQTLTSQPPPTYVYVDARGKLFSVYKRKDGMFINSVSGIELPMLKMNEQTGEIYDVRGIKTR